MKGLEKLVRIAPDIQLHFWTWAGRVFTRIALLEIFCSMGLGNKPFGSAFETPNSAY
jgi:hypothetical protein